MKLKTWRVKGAYAPERIVEASTAAVAIKRYEREMLREPGRYRDEVMVTGVELVVEEPVIRK